MRQLLLGVACVLGASLIATVAGVLVGCLSVVLAAHVMFAGHDPGERAGGLLLALAFCAGTFVGAVPVWIYSFLKLRKFIRSRVADV